MNREPKEGRPYKNVDKSLVEDHHIMCWKCGKIVPDTSSVMYSHGIDIDDLLCKDCDKE